MNNCLHTNLCPYVNSSTQWKQRPSLCHSAISAAIRRLTKGDVLVVVDACALVVLVADCVPYCVDLVPMRPEPHTGACGPA
jgi:hypothetical protein